MTEASTTEQPDPISGADDNPADADLDTLRRILFGLEAERLRRLEQRLNDDQTRSREISRVLPDAIVLSSAENGKIARALQPTIEHSIHVSVRKNPKVLVDAIFPLLGPGIRRAIASTIMGMIQSFNQLLNHSFSLQGLKWRFEALRTRKPYAEIVMLNTLLYQVEQVLLIDRQSGLVLQHVVAPSVDIQDPDLVSGMLTAIEDFVRDSFGVTADQSLDTLRIGNDRSVWIEQGSSAMIAAVIRGTPPLELRHRMLEVLNTIHLKFRSALDGFDGDAGDFEDTRDDLQSCLDTEFKASPTKTSPLLWIAVIVLVALLTLWIFGWIDQRRRLNRFIADLDARPGIVITAYAQRGNRLVISGLRDPLSDDPATHPPASDQSVSPTEYHWQPYVSLDPELVLKRAQRVLDPPPTVTLSLEAGGLLVADGHADHDWIRRFHQFSATIIGIDGTRSDTLVDTDRDRWQAIRSRIEHVRILFAVRSSEIPSDQVPLLETLAADIREVQQLSVRRGRHLAVQLMGYTDDSGSESMNLALSRHRAEAVARFLIDSGKVNVTMMTVGMGTYPVVNETPDEHVQARHRFVACKLIDGVRDGREAVDD